MNNYKIEQMEQVGSIVGAVFANVGITTVDLLLENTKTSAQRYTLAEKTGITESTILKYANMADLFRIDGIGIEYSELLESSGVDTVVELSNRIAENLLEKMSEINEKYGLVIKLPTLSQVENWIIEAKLLPRQIEY